MNNETETEKIIFDAAVEVFLEKGFATAKLKDIAERANINQSLLHYYFRNKENLFKSVIKQKFLELIDKLECLLNKKDGDTENIDEFVLTYHKFFINNPNMPMFFISELNNNPKIIKELLPEDEINRFKLIIIKNFKNTGLQNKYDLPPEQLIISFISLIAFPFVAKEIVKLIFNQDDEQYMNFVKNRTQFLPEIIKNIKK